jgi:MFS transporter, YQGE family, putative transporter
MFDLFFSYVYRFMHRFLGVKRPLSPQEKTLAWMFSFYDFNYALSGVFINIFLFKRHDDLRTVVLFNLTQYAVILPAFWIGGHLSKRWGHLLSYQLGFVFSALVFAVTLTLRENSPDHPYLLGCLSGLGIGFYFLGEHALTLDMTTEKTRDYFYSLTNLFTSILSILAPALAGGLIVLFEFKGSGQSASDSSMGYYIVFGIALAIYLSLVFKSFQFKAKPVKKNFEFWKVLTFPENKGWNRYMAAQFIMGLRGGVFWFLLWILVFRFSQNEAVVGGYSMFCNLLGVLTTYALALWAKAENRWKGLWFSSWLMGLACIGLFFQINYYTIVFYAVLSAIGSSWFNVVSNGVAFKILEKAREAKIRKLEYLAVREAPLAAGRILSLTLFWLSYLEFGENGLHGALLVFGFVHMGMFFVLPKD